jgi:effector-binding domain-containing protein
MEYYVQLEHIASCPLAVVRRRASAGELSRVVPNACGVVWNAVRAQGIPGAGRHVALYQDDQINLEVGVELAARFAGGGELFSSHTPAGLVATTVHFGPYQRLGDAHQAVREWCAKHAYALAGPVWEIYGHWLDEWNDDPSKIRTDVFYLLKPDAGVSG